MADSPSIALDNQQQQQQPQGRSWKQTIFQILLFQMVMRFFSPRQQPQQARDPATGAIIPPLQNSFDNGIHYDLYFHISPDSLSTLTNLPSSQVKDTLVWFLPDQVYNYERNLKDRNSPSTLLYLPPKEVFDIIITQHLAESSEDDDDKHNEESQANVLDRLSGLSKLRKQAEKRKHWMSLYLVVSAVPHSLYGHHPSPMDMTDAINMLMKNWNLTKEDSELIVHGTIDLIEYMKPVSAEEGNNLLDNKESIKTKLTEEPHWKNHLDVRIVYDLTPLTPQGLLSPHLKKYISTVPEKGLYHPILVPSDLWLLERNFIPLNSTLSNMPLNITLSFNTLSSMWWMVQSQLTELWDPQRGLNTDGSLSPLMALQSHSRRETFMVKRIILDTNSYVLAFSAAFMILHSVFSFLAFKNDIQFWNKNDSMQGLSALSIIFNFFCEVIIALYLYDSEETSLLILFEIFLGVAISAWKVTKVINVSFRRKPGHYFPRLDFQDKKDYKESDTKRYDEIAIKFMTIALLPCCLGYSVYSLKTKKYKSWYSFVISSLAGTVYTFGFILMTPQLYINYKLKSVDHLPWRAFTYKALNTFVDDIAAFIIDMPLMHRLACFRDDVIFVCYLYQRWVYSVDKSRPSEWVDGKEQEKLLKEKEEAEKLGKELLSPSVRQRRHGDIDASVDRDIDEDSKKDN